MFTALAIFGLRAPFGGFNSATHNSSSSDKNLDASGARIPFIFFGAIVSALAMFFMPNAEYFTYLLPPLIFGAVMLLFDGHFL